MNSREREKIYLYISYLEEMAMAYEMQQPMKTDATGWIHAGDGLSAGNFRQAANKLYEFFPELERARRMSVVEIAGHVS